MKMIQKSQHCKFCNQLFAKPFILPTIDVALVKNVISVTLVFMGKWYFKRDSITPKD